MNCPFCNSVLVEGPKRKYETLEEHICQPNGDSPERVTYICPKDFCMAQKLKKVCFWDAHGDYYGGTLKDSQGMSSALNSPARKIEIEIYKKDENFVWLKWRGFEIEKIFAYEANEAGEILKRFATYQFSIGWRVHSTSRNPLWAVVKSLHSAIYGFGSAYWKTPAKRKDGIAENKRRLWDEIKDAFNKA